MMRGMYEAIYGPQDDEPVIVAPAPGDPPDPLFKVHLGATPEETRITFRAPKPDQSGTDRAEDPDELRRRHTRRLASMDGLDLENDETMAGAWPDPPPPSTPT